MSLKGLRFTLDVDGQDAGTFAVVNFWLMQNNSVPFVLDVDVASDEFDREAKNLLEKNATLTIWQGPKALRYVKGVVASFGMKENNRWQMLYRFRIQPLYGAAPCARTSVSFSNRTSGPFQPRCWMKMA